MNSLAYFPRPLATVAPRDLLLQQCVEFAASHSVLEVGTGSGSSLFRFANAVKAYHGIDISHGPVERLKSAVAQRRKPYKDVQLFALDFCKPDAAGELPGTYDLVFSCDTLEHVENPQAFLDNVYEAVKPGGQAFITYPNEHPSRAHGITYFERREDVSGLLINAGFEPSEIEIETVNMAPFAERVLAVGWRWPQKLAKAVIYRLVAGNKPADAPQTFEQTDFFTLANRLEPLAPAINAYCWLILRAMAATGHVYRMAAAPEEIWDTRILIRAARPTDAMKENGMVAASELPSHRPDMSTNST